ncbi:hypothetical protein Tco_0692975 [Tanacetum coccineum]
MAISQTKTTAFPDPEMRSRSALQQVSIVKPKNIKEAMADSAWIEAMQDELIIRRLEFPVNKLDIRLMSKNKIARQMILAAVSSNDPMALSARVWGNSVNVDEDTYFQRLWLDESFKDNGRIEIGD